MLKTITWDEDTKSLVSMPEDNATNARRYRAKEVVNTYRFDIKYPNATSGGMNIVVSPEGVSCTCPDFTERGIKTGTPCKHILAVAYLLGYRNAILDQPARTIPNTNQGKAPVPAQDRKWRTDSRPEMVRVGKHFMLSDFLYCEYALSKGVANVPPLEGKEVDSLKGLCAAILDPVVDQFGCVSISYGYSCPDLHRALYGKRPLGLHNCCPPGGAYLGAAADILVHSMSAHPREVLTWIKRNCIYDRLILYPGSPIVCTAWSDKPRYDAKEWIYVDGTVRPQYVNLSDSLPPSAQPISPLQQTLF